jgi:hypothetical protein
MLDPWIIEEILKKEEEVRREHEQLPAELPLERRPNTGSHSVVTPPREESERGVMIIDI